MSITKITDHQQQAFEDLNPALDQERNEAEARIIGDRAQQLEDVIFEIINERGLTVAEGVQLDKIGDLYGLKRAGQTDAQFRSSILTEIIVSRSSGKRPQVLGAMRAFLISLDGIQALAPAAQQPAVDATLLRMFETPPAKFFIQVETDDWSPSANDITRLSALLPRLAAAGVGVRVVTPSATGNTFQFGNLETAQDSTRGWSNLESSDGGIWASTTPFLG